MTTISEVHLNITREIAKQSPCVRRQYGCLITNGDFTTVTCNQRVSSCCKNGCVRDHLALNHGQSVDLGAEIHAEQAALIKWNLPIDKHTKILNQGYYSSTGELMHDEALYPCHVCALMIKYAGFKFVYITDSLGRIYSVSIDEIISYREGVWESYLINE